MVGVVKVENLKQNLNSQTQHETLLNQLNALKMLQVDSIGQAMSDFAFDISGFTSDFQH